MGAALLTSKLGMELDQRDHRVYIEGRLLVRTMVSTGTKYRTLPDPLVAAMAKQLRVTPAQFRAIVDCTIDREGYLRLLQAAGVVETEDQ